MSQTMEIFVDSKASPEEFKQEIERILDLPLEPILGEPCILYRYSNGRNLWFDIRTHFQENEPGLNLADYAYQIDIGTFKIRDSQEAQKAREEFAYQLYEKLKASRRYRLILMRNVIAKLGEFDPNL